MRRRTIVLSFLTAIWGVGAFLVFAWLMVADMPDHPTYLQAVACLGAILGFGALCGLTFVTFWAAVDSVYY